MKGTIWLKSEGNYRNFVLAAGSMDTGAPESLHVVVVEVGQDTALVQVAVLDNLVDGQVLAQLGHGQQIGFGVQILLRHFADVVPGLAIASAAALVREIVV